MSVRKIRKRKPDPRVLKNVRYIVCKHGHRTTVRVTFKDTRLKEGAA